MLHVDRLFLTDPVHTVNGLVFDRGVPPAIHLDSMSAVIKDDITIVYYHEDVVSRCKLDKIVRRRVAEKEAIHLHSNQHHQLSNSTEKPLASLMDC